MDLSDDVLSGLECSGDARNIPDKVFPVVLKAVSESLLVSESDAIHDYKELSSLDQSILKQVHAAVAAFILESAKLDKDPTTVGQVLEECKFSPDRIKQFISTYQNYKSGIRQILSKIGDHPPHIVDANWRLDYYIKNNHLEKVSHPVFLIDLKTQVDSIRGSENVQIACTRDQLQDLVGKLKDACKSLERATQM